MPHALARFLRLMPLTTVLTTGLSLALYLLAPSAEAAQTVVLRYGIFRGSVPVSDLEEFAETGEARGKLKRYLNLANQEPEQFRQILTDEAAIEPDRLDFFLDSPAGDLLMGELSEYIYTSRRNDPEALRTAITTSTENDRRVSFLEVLQNYPTEKVYINVRKAISTYQEFAKIQEDLNPVLEGRLEEILQDINIP
jgi:hypothetical protein